MCRKAKWKECWPAGVGSAIRERPEGPETLELRVQRRAAAHQGRRRWNRDGVTTGAVDHRSIAEQATKLKREVAQAVPSSRTGRERGSAVSVREGVSGADEGKGLVRMEIANKKRKKVPNPKVVEPSG